MFGFTDHKADGPKRVHTEDSIGKRRERMYKAREEYAGVVRGNTIRALAYARIQPEAPEASLQRLEALRDEFHGDEFYRKTLDETIKLYVRSSPLKSHSSRLPQPKQRERANCGKAVPTQPLMKEIRTVPFFRP